MFSFRELTLAAVIIRVLVSVLLGGMIGLERELKSRAAGFRTYMLVCMGACIVMVTNQYIYQVYGTGDPVRMGAQVVSGIGFLGAGTIIVTARSQIKGLTTAAGLWAAACIGLAVGVGFYEVAVMGGLCVFLVLTVLHSWELVMRRNIRLCVLYLELKPECTMRQLLQEVREAKLRLSNVQLETKDSDHVVRLIATINSYDKKKAKKAALLEAVQTLNTVAYFEEL